MARYPHSFIIIDRFQGELYHPVPSGQCSGNIQLWKCEFFLTCLCNWTNLRPIYKRFFRLRQVIGVTSDIPYPNNNNNKIYEKELKFNEISLINIANISVPWSVPDSTSAVSSLFNSAHKILTDKFSPTFGSTPMPNND